MLKNKLTTTLLIACIAASSLSLAGCGHENKLMTGKPKLVADYVYGAWKYAQKESGYNYFYTTCIESPNTYNNPFTGKMGKDLCPKFFKAMAGYETKEKDLRQFNGATADDFSNPKVLKRIYKFYQGREDY